MKIELQPGILLGAPRASSAIGGQFPAPGYARTLFASGGKRLLPTALALLFRRSLSGLTPRRSKEQWRGEALHLVRSISGW